ncbi:PH domain-like [Phytophthora cactorum]|nr:PH domain-like [Phytophthora cactorum]
MATDALHVDRTQSNAMNLQVLKRQDADVMEIVDTASHVVMYEFDQDAQSWKRKDVEGCLFVVKRSSAPRFQIFVNNRLNTTNMTLPLDGRLQVDNAYSSGYAIYGVWFFPEEDRGKILQLLQRLTQSLKAPQNTAIADATPTKAQSPVHTQNLTQQTSQPTQQHEQQQQERPPSQSRNRGRSRNKREDSKRRGANTSQPTAILQRSPKGKRSNSSSSGGSANGSSKQENVQASGMVPISKADGIAAGEAIMGMISQNRPQQHKQPASPVNKEQLKQTLIGLLDDAQFFDQIYHAYVNQTSGGNPFTRFAFASARVQSSSSHAEVKVNVATGPSGSSSAKRGRSEELKKKASPGSDRRLELLLKLYDARKSMETPIDKFGTQVCVAPGVTSAKVERFQLLVAALLSSQTQDPITYAAMQRLHQLGESNEGLTIEVVQSTSEEELSEALKPVGFYHRKAHQLKRVAAILRTQFHGDIPRSLDELLQLPGIGPKIGRVITLLAWGQVDGSWWTRTSIVLPND